MAASMDLKSESKSSYRRSNKPLMEKRRRARINQCLTQLKGLLLQAMKKDGPQFSKLEKADILELTVKYLRNMQRDQINTAMTSDPNVAAKYRAGFNECAGEVLRYLGCVQGIEEEVKTGVMGHLANRLQVVNSAPVVHSAACLQPIHVQIPPNSSPLPVNVSQMESLLIPACHSITANCSTTTSLSGHYQLLSGNMSDGMLSRSQSSSSLNSSTSSLTPRIDTPFKPASAMRKTEIFSPMPIDCRMSAHQQMKEERVWRPW